MSALLCFLACSADLYMTFPFFLRRFPLPPASWAGEGFAPPLLELSLLAPPFPCGAENSKSGAGVGQQGPVQGLLLRLWGAEGAHLSRAEVLPGLCLKPQMALSSMWVRAQPSMPQTCTAFPWVPWREHCTHVEHGKKPEWLRKALFQRAVFILNTAWRRQCSLQLYRRTTQRLDSSSDWSLPWFAGILRAAVNSPAVKHAFHRPTFVCCFVQ